MGDAEVPQADRTVVLRVEVQSGGVGGGAPSTPVAGQPGAWSQAYPSPPSLPGMIGTAAQGRPMGAAAAGSTPLPASPQEGMLPGGSGTSVPNTRDIDRRIQQLMRRRRSPMEVAQSDSEIIDTAVAMGKISPAVGYFLQQNVRDTYEAPEQQRLLREGQRKIKQQEAAFRKIARGRSPLDRMLQSNEDIDMQVRRGHLTPELGEEGKQQAWDRYQREMTAIKRREDMPREMAARKAGRFAQLDETPSQGLQRHLGWIQQQRTSGTLTGEQADAAVRGLQTDFAQKEAAKIERLEKKYRSTTMGIQIEQGQIQRSLSYVGMAAGQAAQSFAYLGIVGEGSTHKLLQGIVRLQAVFGLFRATTLGISSVQQVFSKLERERTRVEEAHQQRASFMTSTAADIYSRLAPRWGTQRARRAADEEAERLAEQHFGTLPEVGGASRFLQRAGAFLSRPAVLGSLAAAGTGMAVAGAVSSIGGSAYERYNSFEGPAIGTGGLRPSTGPWAFGYGGGGPIATAASESIGGWGAEVYGAFGGGPYAGVRSSSYAVERSMERTARMQRSKELGFLRKSYERTRGGLEREDWFSQLEQERLQRERRLIARGWVPGMQINLSQDASEIASQQAAARLARRDMAIAPHEWQREEARRQMGVAETRREEAEGRFRIGKQQLDLRLQPGAQQVQALDEAIRSARREADDAKKEFDRISTPNAVTPNKMSTREAFATAWKQQPAWMDKLITSYGFLMPEGYQQAMWGTEIDRVKQGPERGVQPVNLEAQQAAYGKYLAAEEKVAALQEKRKAAFEEQRKLELETANMTLEQVKARFAVEKQTLDVVGQRLAMSKSASMSARVTLGAMMPGERIRQEMMLNMVESGSIPPNMLQEALRSPFRKLRVRAERLAARRAGPSALTTGEDSEEWVQQQEREEYNIQQRRTRALETQVRKGEKTLTEDEIRRREQQARNVLTTQEFLDIRIETSPMDVARSVHDQLRSAMDDYHRQLQHQIQVRIEDLRREFNDRITTQMRQSPIGAPPMNTRPITNQG